MDTLVTYYHRYRCLEIVYFLPCSIHSFRRLALQDKRRKDHSSFLRSRKEEM